MSTLSPIHPQAVNMINMALSKVIRKGGKIERMQLYVCPRSELAQHYIIKTAFGDLRIHPGDFVPKGYSYLLEDPGGDKRGFAWVSIPKDARITENRQKEA
ncbi:hypothetical protein MHB77_29350 [Paenibacillus sp. FSL K6-3166]|uniref:hypothetical protein n=1 Tax=unclassified Paenibacillus TaxID=185978 RepID=UPI000BA1776F|nr:hypothetical protein [Paenibacillus sp. VTT E-133291]OZQ95833.1 hypothetical protein CA598_08365 [Paenibacillus sp. VTT E-133291]